MIKVSIIVPVYNMERYLKKCLDSLVNQTMKDIEIIAINDGSTDNSLKILNDYKKKYKNVKVFNNENQGISKTRNYGLLKTKGEYISFIDSDDYVDINMFEIMYNKAITDDLDIVVCDYYNYFESSSKKVRIKIPNFPNTTIFDNKKLIFEINQAPWNKIYKRELFDKTDYKFPIGLKYEDLGYIPILLTEAKKIGKVNMPLNYYLIRENGETGTIDRRIFDIFNILDILYDYFKKINLHESKEVEYLFINKLTMYNLQQKFNKDRDIIDEFVNKSFQYLKEKYPMWKKNKYFIKKNGLKVLIKMSKTLTNLYLKTGDSK